MDDLKNIYLEENEELLNTLEKSLLSLEDSPNDNALIDEIFRSMHTIKGNSSMFGFNKIADFVHNLETLYSEIRDRNINVNKSIIECTFSSLDHIKKIVEDFDLTINENKENHKRLTSNLLGYLGSKEVEDDKSVKEDVKNASLKTFHVFFQPSSEVFDDGTNPLYLLEELKSLGKSNVYPHLNTPKTLTDFDPTKCYASWDIVLVTNLDENAIKDVFVFVEDSSKIDITFLINGDGLSIKEFTDNIIYKGLSSPPISFKKLKTILDKIEITSVDTKSSPNLEQENEISMEQSNELVKDIVKAVNEKSKTISSIRVPSDKLDELMNQVSELVTTQAGLSLYSEENFDPTLEVIAENVEKLSRQLRDIAFGMTLVQIETLFGRFQRVTRDLSSQLDKPVSFVTEGGETELDKTIIESLTDPLMHIIRNSLDHGIESKDERLRKGKPEKGTIKLTSYYSGAKVYIQIEDDGKGLDLKKIKQKAIDKKILSEEDDLSDKEIMELIFAPGFSTSENVTELSGRGVGMDVVRRNILDIRGDISIDSTKDKGTKITLGLPLTLSIIDGLLVKVEETFFVIPLFVVDKCHEVKRKELDNDFNQLIVLDDVQTPFLDLRSEFNMNDSTSPLLSSVILIKNKDKKVGICVDSIVGEYQAVLKPVGKYYRNQEFVSGATILGDGTIALVLDTYKIIEQKSTI